MRIGIRHCMGIVALLGLGLGLWIEAAKATRTVEYAGDSNSYDLERAAAALPYAAPSLLLFAGSVACLVHGLRVSRAKR